MSLLLQSNGDGTYSEPEGNDVLWTKTSYTDPRENLETCLECEEEIEEWDMFTCLDDGSLFAHIGCVEVLS